MDILILTETWKKGIGSEYLNVYSHLYSGVETNNRAKAGVSLLIENRPTRNIKDRNAVNDRMLQVELNLKGYEVAIITVYTLSNDDMITNKDDHDEKL